MKGSRSIGKFLRSFTEGDDKLKQAGGIYLTDQFAVQPLLRDIFDLQRLVTNYHAKLEAYKRQGARQSTHYFTKVIPVSCSPLTSTASTQTILVKEHVFRAQARVSYPHHADWKGPGLYTWLGFEVTPATIWNAIPFSFVVDWVYTVGNSLEKFSKQTDANLRVHSYSESVKSQVTKMVVGRDAYTSSGVNYYRSGGAHVAADSFGATVPDGYYCLSAMQSSVYTRLPCEPNRDGWVAPHLRYPTGKAIGLGAAMVAAMGGASRVGKFIGGLSKGG